LVSLLALPPRVGQDSTVLGEQPARKGLALPQACYAARQSFERLHTSALVECHHSPRSSINSTPLVSYRQ
jgi:hypothetical protein